MRMNSPPAINRAPTICKIRISMTSLDSSNTVDRNCIRPQSSAGGPATGVNAANGRAFPGTAVCRACSTLVASVLAIDKNAISRDARGEQGKRGGNDFDDLVHTEPAHRRVQPVQKSGESPGICVFDAAMDQSNAQTIAQADVGPLAFPKPAVGLPADEIQKCH